MTVTVPLATPSSYAQATLCFLGSERVSRTVKPSPETSQAIGLYLRPVSRSTNVDHRSLPEPTSIAPEPQSSWA